MGRRTRIHSKSVHAGQPDLFPGLPGAAGAGKGAASMTAYQAAGWDQAMMDWNPYPGSADADLLPELEVMASRSRDLNRNNGLMAGAMQTKRDNVVGAVLRLSATPDYRLLGWTREQARAWGNNTEARFRSWAETTECDAGRTLNLLGQTLLAFSGAMGNGDAVALPMWLPRVDAVWNTRLMLIESDRLCTPPLLQASSNVRGGIEFDTYGAPVAYHILRQHPGDSLGMFGPRNAAMKEWDRVPAFTPWGRRRVLHLHDKERTGQSRGKPIVSAVMREFHMAGKYSANELQASLANSLVAAFLESDLDQASAAELFGDDPRGAWDQSIKDSRNISLRQLKGAAVIPLPAGAKLNSFAPGRPNAQFEAFMLAVLRHIAAGMNMPYELLLKDFSKTNYSSARAALLEAWRYFQGRRRWLMDYWLKPIYELWLEEAINAGVIEAPGFYENRYAYSRCRFIFGGKGWVDPVKEAQAAQIRMESGLSTLEDECAEQGRDYEEVMDQQRVEAVMRAERGLPPLGREVSVATASAPAQQEREEEIPA
jgi:lambda family phage portal protein